MFPTISSFSEGLLLATPIELIAYILEDAFKFPIISSFSVGLLFAIPIELIA